MSKFQVVTQFKKNGESSIKGYRISLKKLEVEKSGFKADDELEIEYKKNKIIITKKEN